MDRRILILGLFGGLLISAASDSTATAAIPFFKRFFRSRQTTPIERNSRETERYSGGDRESQEPVVTNATDPENVDQSQWEMPVQGSSNRSATRGGTTQRNIRTTQRTAASPATTSSAPSTSPAGNFASRQAVPYRTAEQPSPSQERPMELVAPEGVRAEQAPDRQPAKIEWQSDLHAAHKIAAETGRPMMIVFGAQWCHYCKKLENETLSQPELAEYINTNFVPVHMDMDQPRDKEVAAILDVKPIPCTVILSPNADRVQDKILGFREAPSYYQSLETARAKGINVRQTRFSRILGR